MATNQSNLLKDGGSFGSNDTEALRHDAHSSLRERIEDEIHRTYLIRKEIRSMAPEDFSLGPEYTTLNRAHARSIISTIVCAFIIRVFMADLPTAWFEPAFFSEFMD